MLSSHKASINYLSKSKNKETTDKLWSVFVSIFSFPQYTSSMLKLWHVFHVNRIVSALERHAFTWSWWTCWCAFSKTCKQVFFKHCKEVMRHFCRMRVGQYSYSICEILCNWCQFSPLEFLILVFVLFKQNGRCGTIVFTYQLLFVKGKNCRALCTMFMCNLSVHI